MKKQQTGWCMALTTIKQVKRIAKTKDKSAQLMAEELILKGLENERAKR